MCIIFIYIYAYTYEDVSEADRNKPTTFANDKKIDSVPHGSKHSVNGDGYYC